MRTSTFINFYLSTSLLFFGFLDAGNSAAAPLPAVPERPDGVSATSFHTSQFENFNEIGFVDGSPGQGPCYPESAVVLGSNPPRKNPGTDGPKGTASANPGADCTNPGPYNGQLTHGNPFPVYT
ncbi:MAG: hypothetical protein Q9213_007312 [Squamulea squamosa]